MKKQHRIPIFSVWAAAAAISCFQDSGLGPTTAASSDASGSSTASTSGSSTSSSTTSTSSPPDSTTAVDPMTTTTTGTTTSTSSTTAEVTSSSTSTSSATTGEPLLPPCAFHDDFGDPQLSLGQWFPDNLDAPFQAGQAVAQGSNNNDYAGLRQKAELVDIVDCVTSVEVFAEKIMTGAVVLSIELVGNESDPGDDANNVSVTYTGGDKSTRAAVRVAGMQTQILPNVIVGVPTAFRIVREAARIVPGVRVGGEWQDFDTTPMPDYDQGQQFRVVKLALYATGGEAVAFDNVNLP